MLSSAATTRIPIGVLCWATIIYLGTSAARAAEPAVHSGIIRYEVPQGESAVAPRFRLSAHTFSFQQQPLGHVSDDIAISLITFPSPRQTPHPRNNTVHCEYYQPKGRKQIPAVVVLHILGGDFQLSRTFCNVLAHRGVAAMFLKMPYYGPRRQPGVSRRMISKDPRETVEGMTQAILDIRRAIAWLSARNEVDRQQLGVFGISLGGITGALAATAEPRIQNICLLLAGGDMGRIAWDAPQVADVRQYWTARGGTRDEFLALMQSVDPVHYAANLQGRRVLMLNAKHDEVIPRVCTESLWQALGRPEIVWYDGGHYSVARHFFNALERVTTFFVMADQK